MVKSYRRTSRQSRAQQTLREIGCDALSACDAARGVEAEVAISGRGVVLMGRSVSLRRAGRLLVLAYGKAAATMARGLLTKIREAGGTRRVRCLVIGPGRGDLPTSRSRITVESLRGDHPVPGRASFAAGKRALRLLSSVRRDDDVIFLASGGGSAMMAAPLRPFLGQSVKAALHRLLISAGLPIGAINTVRKQFSAVKGGRLAVAARRARTQTTLVVCDVDPDRFEEVSSGPSLPDSSGFDDVVAAIDRYGIGTALHEAILEALRSGRLPPPVGPGDAAFRRSRWKVILSNRDLREAAIRGGVARGLMAESMNDEITGSVEAAVDRLASRIEIAPAGERLYVMGGEVITHSRGDGVGGRAQELALRLAIRMSTSQGRSWAFLAIGSDGRDGNSPAAGAFVDSSTIERAAKLRLDPDRCLRESSSYAFFNRLQDDIVTGPTGTNVRDLYLLLTDPYREALLPLR
jgi:glycerate-2-kinase